MPKTWNLVLAGVVFWCCSVRGDIWNDPYIIRSQEAMDKGVTYDRNATIDFTIAVPEKGGTIEENINLGTFNFQGGKGTFIHFVSLFSQ